LKKAEKANHKKLQRNMIEILIRRARKSDLLAIQKLLSTYFLDMEELEPEDFILAEAEGKIKGCAALIKSETQGKSFLEIHSIAVHPSFRSKGIGTRLVKHILATVNDQAFDLYVRTTTPGFFEKMNFTRIGDYEKLFLWGDCKNCEHFEKCTQYAMKYSCNC
jgi:amino-acid N-acetyltransferase